MGKKLCRWGWKLAKANALGYAVMLAAFAVLYLCGVDEWWSFWLSKVPSWLVTGVLMLLKR